MTMQCALDAEEMYFSGRARRFTFTVEADGRGTLTPFSFESLPFKPSRCFAVCGSIAGALRGGHAHRKTQQLLVCLRGRIEVRMRFADKEAQVLLEPGSPGLLIGRRVWAQQRYLEAESVLLVFADEPYDPDSYIEDVATHERPEADVKNPVTGAAES